ncbi:MAG: hypothetical protein KAT23_08715 [Anaerolineales bacterium]|nr:hypothetical protein [Anaerolineales bacterium]
MVRRPLTWLGRWQADRRTRLQISRVEDYLRVLWGDNNSNEPPVIFFNASTRISLLSMNAVFNLLASWAIRSKGVPAGYAVCQRGMVQCMLGTNQNQYSICPPCDRCVRFSNNIFPAERVLPLTIDMGFAKDLIQQLEEKTLLQLFNFEHEGFNLGELCLPSLRWALRRHNIPDNEAPRGLFLQYLVSAVSLACQFNELYERLKPCAVVIFNGITYPEAVARAVAHRRGIPVITHEVGLRPYSAFFTHDLSTFREVEIPSSLSMGQEENRRLDAYLEERFRGRFTMAGISFWPQMQSLPETLLEHMNQHKQMVAVFTNVIFDTSQVHANTIFSDMFAWLDDLKEVIKHHSETLFVIRAHPDEDRPGKESRESVIEWIRSNHLTSLPNVVFFSPSEYISSYELIRKAKCTLVYNSSIGLEASILGCPVLCAGRARYTQIPTVFFLQSRQAYLKQLETFLELDMIEVPSEHVLNARRFLYYELFHASVDFSAYMQTYPAAPGNVALQLFDPALIKSAQEMEVLRQGILRGHQFSL